MSQNIGQSTWEETAALMGHCSHTFSDHWAYNFRTDPKRLAFVLSRYKFVAKLASRGRSILELGCGEGIGAPILREAARHYTGIDYDPAAITSAQHSFSPDSFTFLCEDFMNKTYGLFDTVVSLDVVEHILPLYETSYFTTIHRNLSKNGIAVIGTPNQTAAPYASHASQLGHVNLFTQDRLKRTLQQYFHTVLPFGMNDETLHTGYSSMSHYLICLCCNPKALP